MEKTVIKLKSSVKNIPIFVGENVCSDLYKILGLKDYHQIFVLSNKTVWKLYADKITKGLKAEFHYYLVNDGERYKNLGTVTNIINELVRLNATRGTLFIAIGGGVVGDLGGFVASVYHRGMPLVHIPTTLLAQVDSSIGGKTGFNLKEGKNLVGSFYQPTAVVVDTDFLKTLPDQEYSSGLAEIVKAGLIKDKKLFYFIKSNVEKISSRNDDALQRIIKSAQKVKIGVVSKDEKESGLRAILNFGHTLGHAIEKSSNWKIKHGYAVAIGMAFASYVSYFNGNISKNDFEDIIKLLKMLGLPYSFKFDAKKLIEYVKFDKKRKINNTEWVFLKKIGDASFGNILKHQDLQALFEKHPV